MSKTGHRSLDRMRSYKRVPDEQQKHLSEVLNLQETSVKPTPAKKAKTDIVHVDKENTEAPFSSKQPITFSGCTGITINFGK